MKLSFGIVRCLGIGVIYSVTNVSVAALLGQTARLAPTLENALIWTLTGTIIALCLSPFIRHSSWPRNKIVLAVWAFLVFVRAIGLGIEGALFKPATATNQVVNAITGTFVLLWIAWVAVRLLAPKASAVGERISFPSSIKEWWGWIWRVMVGGLAYLVFYFGFGAANAFLYTLSFYKNNPQYGLSLPPVGVIFLALLIRGPLMALGAALLARSVSVPRRQLAVWLGLLLFVVDGLAAYIETTFRTMPLGFSLATLAELFFQNFLAGVVVAYLFGKKNATVVSKH